MEMKRGVLWDLDGVLVSTGDFHFQAWSRTLAEYEIPLSQEQFRATFGMNNTGILKTLLGETVNPDLIALISDTKEQTFRDAIKGHVRLLPGVHDWLNRFRNLGFGQAIASSAPSANIDALVDELGIRHYFSAIVSGSDLPGKPDPAVFLAAARQIGVAPRKCVVFEDAVAGVQAAKRAGMKCVAVTTTNPARLLNDADTIVERLDALSEDEITKLLKEVLATGQF